VPLADGAVVPPGAGPTGGMPETVVIEKVNVIVGASTSTTLPLPDHGMRYRHEQRQQRPARVPTRVRAALCQCAI
jgi:hypothetical protein